jgi:hypothetical protein
MVASAMEVLGAGSASQGAIDVEVADVIPQLGDSARSLLLDLVVCDVGAGIPGSVAQVMRLQLLGPQVP